MSLDTYISDLHISEGESIRSDCPSCKGRNTFTATKVDGTVVFNCYRLSCASRGKINVGLNREDIYNLVNKVEIGERSAETFIMPEYITHDISKPIIKAFMSKWGLLDNLTTSYVMYDVKDERVVFPIRDDKGALIDAIGRSLTGKQPKWLRYSGKADYYVQHSLHKKKKAIIVEDVVSALVVYDTIPDTDGIAILGTSLNHRHKDYLCKYDTVIVALDPDAKKKTIAYTKEIRNYVSTVIAFNLTDDIKYRSVTDIEELKRILV